HQRADLQQFLQDHDLGEATLQPLVRARLVAINQQAVSSDDFDSRRARDTVRREFNLSWVDKLPESNAQRAGRWLDHDRDEVSLEEKFAARLGVEVGDTLTFNFAGDERSVTVA